jgi:hypothetical protein
MLSTRSIGFFVCALCATLAISVGLADCGDSAPTGEAVVATVDSHSITKTALDHWTAVEAVLAYETEPKRPVPAGTVPDPPTYAKCVARLEKTTSPASSQPMPTPLQLKRQCQGRRRSLQRHVLDILLIYYWLSGDAVEQGVKVTSAEVKQTLDRIFPNSAAYRRYLSITGERPSDERLIIEKDLLDTKLLELAEAKTGTKPASVREHEQALVKAATAFTNKWKARTSCSAGYVVAECKQYKGPPSLIAP